MPIITKSHCLRSDVVFNVCGGILSLMVTRCLGYGMLQLKGLICRLSLVLVRGGLTQKNQVYMGIGMYT